MIGYARVGDTADEDGQRTQLTTLGVRSDHIHVDTGLQGTRHRLPNRDAMLDALCPGDTVDSAPWSGGLRIGSRYAR